MSHNDRKQRKKKKREERLRQEKHQRNTMGRHDKIAKFGDELNHDFDSIDEGGSEAISPAIKMPFSEFTMERTLRKMAHSMSAQSFNKMEDMNSFLQANFVGKIDDDLSKLGDPKEHAQELAFQAMEADNEFEGKRLAQEALKLDPDCVDARVQLAHLNCGGKKEQLLIELQHALEAGKRALGGQAGFGR